MKKRLGTGITLFVALIFVLINLPASPAWAGDVTIDATNFPDKNFRDYVGTLDKDSDGKLSDMEIAGIKSISVTSKNIADLKGIEYFTALQTLNCAYNQLRSLDISKNTALKVLNCHDNKLTNLDLSKNPALETLKCSVNQLSTLDISKNTALISLTCFSSQLTNLDVSKNTALQELGCDGNQLTSLDVSKNTALQRLECWENQLTSLDVSKNTALQKLNCKDNQLTSLDVSKNMALIVLHCNSNQLTSLDVSKNTALEELWCDGNQLTSLDVSKNTALKNLRCSDNQLTSLDVSKNRELVYLNCMENQLTSLDLSHNIAGSRLKCNAQKYDVEIRTTDMKIPYADFPGTFDITKAGYIVGADSNFKVDLTKPSTVTYNYYTGSDTILGSYPTMYNITLNITYYVYIVRFDTNGGSEVSVQIIKKGDHVTIPTAPTKDGFTFAGWYKDAGLTTPFDFANETINADITLYAKWTPTTPTNYTVTFNTNGGSAINPQTITAGGLVTKPAAPTKDGYTFAGWYKDAEFTKAFDFANEKINADTTIYAKWTQNAVTPTPEQFTITFDKNGGTGIMADVTVNKGETYKLPICAFTAPDGKEFKAWQVGTKEKAVGDTITVDANTTVKAIWKKAGQPSKPHGGGVSSSTGTVTEPKEPQKPDEEKPAIDGSSAAYLAGYPDGSIRPDGVITRAESAKIIALLKEMDVSNTEKPAFGDVASGWYNPYINAVVRAGLMKGYLDGTFKPNAPITRAEFAQMIMPLDKENSAAAPFADVKGHWAEKAINQAYGNGRIKGYPDGTFRPDGQITRAEAVTICNNLFNRKVDEEGLKTTLKNPEKIKTFTDLDKSHWAYYEILEAANAHDYQIRHKGQMVENWIEVK